MRIAVTGGREFNNYETVYCALEALGLGPEDTLVHGGARGADSLAGEAARALGANIEVYPAQWDQLGKSAGMIRNRQMASSGLDMLVAFEGGRGTANMVLECKRRGIPVKEIR